MMRIASIPRQGDSSKAVVSLQTALAVAGFNPGKLDGVFGPKTSRQLKAFQRAKGLPATGLIGPNTLRLLELDLVTQSPVTVRRTITRELAGRVGRHLHPTLRVLIEDKLFPNQSVPACFASRDLPECVRSIAFALMALGIREQGENHGEIVGYIQGIIGEYTANGNGDSWCMSTDQCIIAFIEDFFGIPSPVLASENCVAVFEDAAKQAGLGSLEPVPGSFWIAERGESGSGHTGTVLAVHGNQFETFEGNTSDSSIADGDGAYFRTRDLQVNGQLITRGFVFTYPDNKLPAKGPL